MSVGVGFDDAKAAAQRGDFATALSEFLPYAEEGLAEVQYIITTIYDFGKGVPENGAEAAKWFCKAAKQGCEGISLIDTPALPLATVAV